MHPPCLLNKVNDFIKLSLAKRLSYFKETTKLPMEFRELSDEEWGVISFFPPPKPRRGRRALSDDRSLINGILYVVTTGCRWREMPENGS